MYPRSVLKLNYPTLIEVCRMNGYMEEICNRTDCWKEKVEYDFGVSHLKPSDENYLDQYLRLMHATDPDEEALHLDSLLVLSKSGLLPTVRGANRAAINNQIDTLNWMWVRGISP